MAEVVALTGKLDLTSVRGVHAMLLAHNGQDIEVDLSEVSQIGALCLQVLIATANKAAARGTAFSITRATPRVAEQMAAMGRPVETLTRKKS
ncbi:MAG: STAS domain-containing protein [Sulfitobacter sp.]